MDERQWQEQVLDLEKQARDDPRRYRRRVLAIAKLGYVRSLVVRIDPPAGMQPELAPTRGTSSIR